MAEQHYVQCVYTTVKPFEDIGFIIDASFVDEMGQWYGLDFLQAMVDKENRARVVKLAMSFRDIKNMGIETDDLSEMPLGLAVYELAHRMEGWKGLIEVSAKGRVSIVEADN